MKEPVEQIKTIQDIRNAFEGGLITAKEATTLIGETSIKKPWHTKEWTERRNELIQDKCTQCGSEKEPFVLQHLWHPRKLSSIASDIRYDIQPLYEQTHPIPELTPPAPEAMREGCPECHRFSYYWRKTTEDWRCANQNCKHIFKEPADIPVLSTEQATEWYPLVRKAEEVWKQEFRDATEESVLAQALPIAFAQHDRYVSLKDTTTFCKKCAFMWDIRKKKLCSKCGSFIPIHMNESNCFTCLDKEFAVFDEYLESMYKGSTQLKPPKL